MPNNQLSDNQKRALDEMLERRMKNTGETREQAVNHITEFLLAYTQDESN
jgi:hypothetical protein